MFLLILQLVIIKKININNVVLFMKNNYINFYNNLVQLTRNKDLYKNFNSKDEFSDRLILLLLHFAFFFKIYKNKEYTKILQEIYDFTFRQLELSIREIGYGDQSINKKMKDYLNLFHSIIDKIHFWDELNIIEKRSIIDYFLSKSNKNDFLVHYFEDFRLNLSKNTLNSYLKSVSTQ